MTQAEAQGLIQVLKRILQQGSVILPHMGSKIDFELRSIFSENDRFAVIVNRSSKIRKDKYTLCYAMEKIKGFYVLTWVILTILIQTVQWFHVLMFTFSKKTLELGMLGPHRFRQSLETLRIESKPLEYFSNTAMLITLVA